MTSLFLPIFDLALTNKKYSYIIEPHRYECLSAPLNNGSEANAWWLDRNSDPHFYWSGDATVETKYGFQVKRD